jgi:hypothetical protein
VETTTGVYFGTVEIGGDVVPLLIEPAPATIAPPVLTGHPVDRDGQIVLGSATLAALHKKLGDQVVVAGDGIPARRMVIVGTATLPTIGTVLGVHPTMTTGAVIPTSAVPKALLDQFGPDSGPNADGGTLQLLGPQRPAEIVNYRAMGTTPGLLAGGLAVGAVAALGLTLVASVRQRRRELALLKSFGFTQRQLAAAVAWQSTAIVGIGLVAGIPLGIALGRFLWQLFAHQLAAVVDPTIPALPILLVAVGAFLVANLVAALPGRSAARTPTALVLRVE